VEPNPSIPENGAFPQPTPDPVYDEREILARVARGDQYAFRLLFDRHRDKVYSFALFLTRFEPTAEEITQDVFTKAWTHREELPKLDYFLSWLRTVARNEAYNYLKRKARERLAFLDLAGHAGGRLLLDQEEKTGKIIHTIGTLNRCEAVFTSTIRVVITGSHEPDKAWLIQAKTPQKEFDFTGGMVVIPDTIDHPMVANVLVTYKGEGNKPFSYAFYAEQGELTMHINRDDTAQPVQITGPSLSQDYQNELLGPVLNYNHRIDVLLKQLKETGSDTAEIKAKELHHT
jgi:RNA polymerase sigma factor (sigma-70 family)